MWDRCIVRYVNLVYCDASCEPSEHILFWPEQRQLVSDRLNIRILKISQDLVGTWMKYLISQIKIVDGPGEFE